MGLFCCLEYSDFGVRLVVEGADGADGVFEEVRQGVLGDLFDGFFSLTVVVDGRVLDGDAIKFGDEVVGQLFGFSGQIFVGVVLDVKEDFTARVHIHDCVFEGTITDVEAADLAATWRDVAAELSRGDKSTHHGFTAIVAAEVSGFLEDVECIQCTLLGGYDTSMSEDGRLGSAP